MERVKGIEPSSLAWEAKALPLSYTRMSATVDLRPLPLSAARVNPLLATALQRAVSQIVSIATKVEVLATCGKLEIFSPSTMR